MMTKRSCCTAAAVALFLALGLSSFCLGGETGPGDMDPQKLRAQVSAGWKEALEAAKRLQCSYTLKEINLDRDRAISMHATGHEKATDSYHVGAFELLSSTEQFPGMSRISYSYVRGVNSKYLFSIAKEVGKPDWVLKDISLSPTKEQVARVTGLQDFQALGLFKLGGPVADFLNKKGVQIVSAKVAEGGLVRVVFEQRLPEEDYVSEGRLLLDPEALWCLREFESTSRSKDLRFWGTGTYRYERSKDGFPLLDRVVWDSTATKGKDQLYHLQRTVDLRTSLRDGVPEYEFSLSAFGLSEPAGIDMPRPRGYLWFYLAGACCLLLSLAVGWRVRRSRSKGAATLREARP